MEKRRARENHWQTQRRVAMVLNQSTGPPTSLTSDWGRAAISAGQFFRLRTLGTLARILHNFAQRPVSHRLLFCWRGSPSLFRVKEAFYCLPFESLSTRRHSLIRWTMLAPRYRRPRTLGGRRTTIIWITLSINQFLWNDRRFYLPAVTTKTLHKNHLL